MRKRKGFTLIELLVVVAIIALLISILLPSLSRARELSKRLVCAANLRGIGTACKIYANENQELWPVPAFSEQAARDDAQRRIEYTAQFEDSQQVPVLRRFQESVPDQGGGVPGSRSLSTTRAYWMMVRSGQVTVKQFICPSSDDIADDTNEIDRYYDFKSVERISYGYLVPFGPRDTRPSENSDGRLAMAADKGPFAAGCPTGWSDGDFDDFDDLTANDRWKPLNSPNHGGRGAGEGQNVLYQDGHVDFERKPNVGVDDDNIYTHMDMQSGNEEQGRWVGTSPRDDCGNFLGLGPDAYPGEDTLGDNLRSLTDSLIWP